MAPRRRGAAGESEQGRGAFQAALRDLLRFLSKPGMRGAVIGGVAVIARGVARVTADIDVAVVAPIGGPAEVLRALRATGFEPRIPDAVAFAEENLVVLVRHAASQVDVDVSLAQLEFEADAIAGAESLRFGSLLIPVPSATDLVIYKMIAARPKDLQDVEALVGGGAAVDRSRVTRALHEFDALLDLNRAAEWADLVRRLDAPGE